jgi:hypothetical protein
MAQTIAQINIRLRADVKQRLIEKSLAAGYRSLSAYLVDRGLGRKTIKKQTK